MWKWKPMHTLRRKRKLRAVAHKQRRGFERTRRRKRQLNFGWKPSLQLRREPLARATRLTPWQEEDASGANGTTQLAPPRQNTREEAGPQRVALPYEVLEWLSPGVGAAGPPWSDRWPEGGLGRLRESCKPHVPVHMGPRHDHMAIPNIECRMQRVESRE